MSPSTGTVKAVRAGRLEFGQAPPDARDAGSTLAGRVADAPVASLPELVGALARAHALALARLLTPTPERQGPEVDALLTMPEVARRLAVTEYQAREMGRRGDLPTIAVGRGAERLVRRLASH